METILLNKSEVGSLINLDRVFDAVEDGYRSFNNGKVVQPDFVSVVTPGTHEGMDIKCGLDSGGGYITIKASSGGYDKNPSLGLPTGINTVMLFDANTSALKCIMDGTWITGCRTAAAGAISVKYLARKNAERLGIIGSGNQARRQLRAIMRVRKLSEVYVWSYNKEKADNYACEMSKETGLNIKSVSTAQEAVKNADIIVTVTRGRRGPAVKREWIKPGTHIVAIGADMPDKQELDENIFKGAKIVNDSIELCAKNGETHHALENGIINMKDIHAEIGEIILGNKTGRENDNEITIFDTVGMAIQDNVMAAYLYKAAVEKSMGIKYDFLK